MSVQRTTSIAFMALLVAGMFAPHPALSIGVNQFYEQFVAHLKASQYVTLEQLVRQNQGVAEKSLKIIRHKLEAEQDTRRGEAYVMVAQELDELIAVTAGKKDCDMSAKIARRGQGTAIPEDALEAFRRAVELCPENIDAILGMAESNKRLGRFDETVAAYDKVLAMKKDAPEALLGLGEVLYSAGLYERSVPFLEKVLNLEPGNKKAKTLLASCIKQSALDRDGLIPSGEIVDRLWASVEGDLMCMCPVHAKLMARIRFRSITFSTGSTRLDAAAKTQLAELAIALKTDTLKAGRYLIEGHADPSGPPEYNIVLSARRAEAARRYLVEVLGVHPALVSAAGAGASRSWTSDDTIQGRQANRRIEIISLGHGDNAASSTVAEKSENPRRHP